MKNIIIQAGGLGTRLKHNTKNKPKCLVPVNGKPIIQYLLEKYSKSNFFIIADYKIDILQKYVDLFYKNYNIKIIVANGKGTCSGINLALENIKEEEETIGLIWSDLILEEDLQEPESDIVVYKTNSVVCRYSVENDKIIKKTSDTNGVVGLFCFKNKKSLSSLRESGSFVGEFLQQTDKKIIYKNIDKIKEIGTIELLNKNTNKIFCRFFNNIEVKDGKFIKNCINDKFKNVSEDENNWYKYIQTKNYLNIPQIYNFEPLTLQFVNSRQCHKFNFTNIEKDKILHNISKMMIDLHSLDTIETKKQDILDVYVNKLFQRVESIQSLIPFIQEEELLINNKKLKNPFHESNRDFFTKCLSDIECNNFNIIHGDSTFSNILVKEDLNTLFIDPRGSFGKTKIYGDKDYDYSKLYYSMIGNYDSINSREFEIDIEKNTINYILKNNGWEKFEDLFYKLFPIKKDKNLLLNSSIWFSLCGYVIEDYDAILLSFCRGVEYWNKYLENNFQT